MNVEKLSKETMDKIAHISGINGVTKCKEMSSVKFRMWFQKDAELSDLSLEDTQCVDDVVAEICNLEQLNYACKATEIFGKYEIYFVDPDGILHTVILNEKNITRR